MQIYYTGAKLKVMHTPDATATLVEAEAHCTLACARQLSALIKRLADRGRLGSGDQFVKEGEDIWAIKTRCGLRAYGWYYGADRGVFVISHYINKKRRKMLPADVDRVKKNRKIYDPGDK